MIMEISLSMHNKIDNSFSCTDCEIRLSVLVVGKDSTYLHSVSSTLKTWNCQVVEAEHAKDVALTIGTKKDAFDLMVIIDMHVIEMGESEMQKLVEAVTTPVVLLADGEQTVANSNAILDGVVVQVIFKDDYLYELRRICQSSLESKKYKITNISPLQSGSITEESKSNSNVVAGDKRRREEGVTQVRSLLDLEGEEENATVVRVCKKRKVVWTNSLHRKFLETVAQIGLERAVPKKILELMDVHWLTRENVASHLQKYRMFLKNVAAAEERVEQKLLTNGLLKQRSTLMAPSYSYYASASIAEPSCSYDYRRDSLNSKFLGREDMDSLFFTTREKLVQLQNDQPMAVGDFFFYQDNTIQLSHEDDHFSPSLTEEDRNELMNILFSNSG